MKTRRNFISRSRLCNRPLCLLFALTTQLTAQHRDAVRKHSFPGPDDRRRGGEFFRPQCGNCHGIDGRDEAMVRVITRVIFSMNGPEIWQVVSCVQPLSLGRWWECAGCYDGRPPELAGVGQRLSRADREPGNRLTHHGSYASLHCSALRQITRPTPGS